MIVVTGAAGFIGSVLLSRLNEMGRQDILIADNRNLPSKERNLVGKRFQERLHFRELLQKLDSLHNVEVIYHLGARTDTIENDQTLFEDLNISATKALWTYATQRQIPFIYASSAATYGLGELGFSDNHDLIPSLQPLNPYAWSKQLFDLWALQQEQTPPFWAGLKFFNVFGPNEAHKGRMASVVYHAFLQIQERGRVRLFRSHDPRFKDGEQQRDFIDVRDVVDMAIFLAERQPDSGLYNIGTGAARTFMDLALACFAALGREPLIDWIDTPEDLRGRYQYRTCAEMTRLRSAGYQKPTIVLEDGVRNYVTNYLIKDQRL